MPWGNLPRSDVPAFQWPYWEVGLRDEDLFGELHQRFNTMPNPGFIQDPSAFHADVFELARICADKEEFLARLQQRRDERLKELEEFRSNLYIAISHGYTCLDSKQRFELGRLDRYASFDTLVSFYGTLIGPDEEGKQPREDEEFFRRRRERQIWPDASASPAPPSADATDPASPSQSKMPTPPHQSTTYSAPVGPAAELQPPGVGQEKAGQGNGKRKALHDVEDDEEHHAKRQRSAGANNKFNVSPTETTTVDLISGLVPVLGGTVEAANTDQSTLSQHNDSNITKTTRTTRSTNNPRPQKVSAPAKTARKVTKKRQPGPKASARKTKAAGVASDPKVPKPNVVRHRGLPDSSLAPRRSNRIAAKNGQVQKDRP
ncbi:hypothetical protein G6O67_007836 [Ophiocordyceps sinensis]|uniref:Uncharacterized protein n=2 Tax=Ophiocordyceps sinensis TaxID=72228 RepID=A0A8H4LUN5_9HYPO|nr:hypothetical protein OCS_01923 [Ophiocordyceps sinensis CO18]KAF4505938.1 hypothetical protein G6O67_007836 [Ophiocordyceps sinensis]